MDEHAGGETLSTVGVAVGCAPAVVFDVLHGLHAQLATLAVVPSKALHRRDTRQFNRLSAPVGFGFERLLSVR